MPLKNYFFIFALIVFGVAGCSTEPVTINDRGVRPRQEFEIEGKVVSVDKQKRRVTLDHKEIPGYMEAMTMPFAIADESYFDILQPGDELRGLLVIENNVSRIEQIAVGRSEPMPPGAPGSTPAPDAPREPEINSQIESFRLTDEHDEPLISDDLRGRVVLLTFIYTRCPLPDQCPLLTDNFARVARSLGDSGVQADRAQLIEISFDTQHDTPAVLRDYERRTITDAASRERISFATGDESEVRRLADSLGMGYMRGDKAEFNHALRTALVAPDGKLIKLYRGNEWQPEEVAADIRAALAGANPIRGE